jgi:hypothetical protein
MVWTAILLEDAHKETENFSPNYKRPNSQTCKLLNFQTQLPDANCQLNTAQLRLPHGL